MIVCADDYGLAEDMDAAILELAAAGRLSAVSCMVLLARCNTALLQRLQACGPGLDIGLHVCLTNEQNPLSVGLGLLKHDNQLPSFGELLTRSISRSLTRAEAEDAIAAQYYLFLSKFNRKPDFIDGHLHVHQLPVIRKALIRFVLSLPASDRPYIRNTFLPLNELRQRALPWVKAAWIGLFGRQTQRLLQQAGIATNDGFAGIYDFRKWERYPQWLPRFVDCLSSGNSILVVHPGFSEAWRAQEHRSLQTFAFPHGSPSRFKRN